VFDRGGLDGVSDPRVPTGLGGLWYGVYPAVVRGLNDPDGQGRVRVALNWSPDPGGAVIEVWARLATLMGGNNRGSWFVPDIGDEVLVGFEGGNPKRGYVLGGLWNGKDAPPESMDSAEKNFKKVLRSRNGVKVTLDDTDGRETLTLETPGGQTVTLKDGPGSIELKDANGNSIKLDTTGITISSAGKLTITASTKEVSAGMVTVNAGMSRFSGVVQSDTNITNSTVSASYTPGAGNIW